MTNPCLHCGRPNRTAARFCAECGAALSTTLAASAIEAAGEAVIEAAPAAVTEAVTAVASACDPLPSDPLPDLVPNLVSETGAGLAAGAWIAARYYVRGGAPAAADVLGATSPRVYEVEDHGVCPLCGAPAASGSAPTAEEPYCTECGAHLLAPALHWPLRRLVEHDRGAGDDRERDDRERDDGASENGASENGAGDGGLPFIWAGRAYALLDTPSATGAAGVRTADPADLLSPALDPAKDPAHGLFLLAGQRTDVGIERAGRTNEDSIFSLTLTAPALADSLGLGSLGLYIVADGMGGHMDGEIASRAACTVISTLISPVISPDLPAGRRPAAGGLAAAAHLTAADLLPRLVHAVGEANRQIYEAARAAGSNMGSTAVVALVGGGQALVANVGDSRAYLWSRDGLRRLTADHSHVFTLLQKGLIDEDAIYTHPRRNEIYRSLGAAPTVEVDCCQTALRPGDLLLLCSDGLWEMLRSEGIADVLLLNLGNPQAICDELVRRANLAGGEDNISVIVVAATGV